MKKEVKKTIPDKFELKIVFLTNLAKLKLSTDLFLVSEFLRPFKTSCETILKNKFVQHFLDITIELSDTF